MREICSCGAQIKTLSYRRVKTWRENHHHPAPEQPLEPTEPDKQGSQAQVEHAGRRYFEAEASPYGGTDTPIVQAKVGFTVE